MTWMRRRVAAEIDFGHVGSSLVWIGCAPALLDALGRGRGRGGDGGGRRQRQPPVSAKAIWR